jgi:hypothetical protein
LECGRAANDGGPALWRKNLGWGGGHSRRLGRGGGQGQALSCGEWLQSYVGGHASSGADCSLR